MLDIPGCSSAKIEAGNVTARKVVCGVFFAGAAAAGSGFAAGCESSTNLLPTSDRSRIRFLMTAHCCSGVNDGKWTCDVARTIKDWALE